MRAFFCHSRACLAREESRFFARGRMKIDTLWSKGGTKRGRAPDHKPKRPSPAPKLLFREIMQLNTSQVLVLAPIPPPDQGEGRVRVAWPPINIRTRVVSEALN